MDAVPGADAAALAADSESYTLRWGGYLFLDAAAEHFERLCAMHGPRRDVTLFPAHLVLRHLKKVSEERRMAYWIQKHMPKQKA